MKPYSSLRKKGCLCFSLSLTLLLLLKTQAGAEMGNILHILIRRTENQTITYAIDSNYAHGDAVSFSAAYNGNQMTELHTKAITIGAETVEKSQDIAATYDDAKVFLFDPVTFEPLSKPGQRIQASIVDYNGALLSQQTLWSGHCIGYPGTPTRQGYCFFGWDKPLSALYEDTVYTATYIENTVPNILAVSSAQGVKGKEITVSVNLTGAVKTCGFSMALSYDGNVLEYKSLDAEWTMDVVANHVAAENRIYFNYSAKGNRTAGGKVLEATFTVRDTAEGFTTLELVSPSVVCVDDNDVQRILNADYTTTKGVVYIQ